MADPPQGPAFLNGSMREGPGTTVAIGTPMERGSPIPHYTSEDEEVSTDASTPERSFHRDILEGEIEAATVAVTQMTATPPE